MRTEDACGQALGRVDTEQLYTHRKMVENVPRSELSEENEETVGSKAAARLCLTSMSGVTANAIFKECLIPEEGASQHLETDSLRRQNDGMRRRMDEALTQLPSPDSAERTPTECNTEQHREDLTAQQVVLDEPAAAPSALPAPQTTNTTTTASAPSLSHPLLPPTILPSICQLLLIYIQRAALLAAVPQPFGIASQQQPQQQQEPQQQQQQPHVTQRTQSQQPQQPQRQQQPCGQVEFQKPGGVKSLPLLAVRQLRVFGIPETLLLQAAAHLMVVGAILPPDYKAIQTELGVQAISILPAAELMPAAATMGGAPCAAVTGIGTGPAAASADAPQPTDAGLGGGAPEQSTNSGVPRGSAATAAGAAGSGERSSPYPQMAPAGSFPGPTRTTVMMAAAAATSSCRMPASRSDGATAGAAPWISTEGGSRSSAGKGSELPHPCPDPLTAVFETLWTGRGGGPSPQRLGLGRRLFRAIADQLPRSMELDSILPPLYGFSGVLYKSRGTADVGAALWDGALLRDLGAYSTAADARQSVLISIKLITAAAAAAATSPANRMQSAAAGDGAAAGGPGGKAAAAPAKAAAGGETSGGGNDGNGGGGDMVSEQLREWPIEPDVADAAEQLLQLRKSHMVAPIMPPGTAPGGEQQGRQMRLLPPLQGRAWGSMPFLRGEQRQQWRQQQQQQQQAVNRNAARSMEAQLLLRRQHQSQQQLLLQPSAANTVGPQPMAIGPSVFCAQPVTTNASGLASMLREASNGLHYHGSLRPAAGYEVGSPSVGTSRRISQAAAATASVVAAAVVAAPKPHAVTTSSPALQPQLQQERPPAVQVGAAAVTAPPPPRQGGCIAEATPRPVLLAHGNGSPLPGGRPSRWETAASAAPVLLEAAMLPSPPAAAPPPPPPPLAQLPGAPGPTAQPALVGSGQPLSSEGPKRDQPLSGMSSEAMRVLAVAVGECSAPAAERSVQAKQQQQQQQQQQQLDGITGVVKMGGSWEQGPQQEPAYGVPEAQRQGNSGDRQQQQQQQQQPGRSGSMDAGRGTVGAGAVASGPAEKAAAIGTLAAAAVDQGQGAARIMLHEQGAAMHEADREGQQLLDRLPRTQSLALGRGDLAVLINGAEALTALVALLQRPKQYSQQQQEHLSWRGPDAVSNASAEGNPPGVPFLALPEAPTAMEEAEERAAAAAHSARGRAAAAAAAAATARHRYYPPHLHPRLQQQQQQGRGGPWPHAVLAHELPPAQHENPSDAIAVGNGSGGSGGGGGVGAAGGISSSTETSRKYWEEAMIAHELADKAGEAGGDGGVKRAAASWRHHRNGAAATVEGELTAAQSTVLFLEPGSVDEAQEQQPQRAALLPQPPHGGAGQSWHVAAAPRTGGGGVPGSPAGSGSGSGPDGMANSGRVRCAVEEQELAEREGPVTNKLHGGGQCLTRLQTSVGGYVVLQGTSDGPAAEAAAARGIILMHPHQLQHHRHHRGGSGGTGCSAVASMHAAAAAAASAGDSGACRQWPSGGAGAGDGTELRVPPRRYTQPHSPGLNGGGGATASDGRGYGGGGSVLRHDAIDGPRQQAAVPMVSEYGSRPACRELKHDMRGYSHYLGNGGGGATAAAAAAAASGPRASGVAAHSSLVADTEATISSSRQHQHQQIISSLPSCGASYACLGASMDERARLWSHEPTPEPSVDYEGGGGAASAAVVMRRACGAVQPDGDASNSSGGGRGRFDGDARPGEMGPDAPPQAKRPRLAPAPEEVVIMTNLMSLNFREALAMARKPRGTSL